MPVSKQEVVIQIWRLLKQPFLLPSNFKHTHTCAWQPIDAGLLGCTLCGRIHACSDLRCQNVIETDDGTVCALSGMYIREKQYVLTEFQDTVNLTDGKLSHRIVEETMYSDIKSIFQLLLISNVAESLHFKQQILLINRWHEQYKRHHSNVMLWCVYVLQEAQQNIRPFDKSKRAHISSVASKQCYNVLTILVTQFGMHIKSNEVQEIAVGLLYLMRSGIKMKDKIILPVLPCLRELLPPENMLKTHFDIRAKYITESENRAKVCLRSCNLEQFQSIDFLLPQLKKPLYSNFS